MSVATRPLFTGVLPDAPMRGAPVTLTAAPAGGWSWFSGPNAVQYGGRTYVGYVRGDNADIAVRAVGGPEVVLHAALADDDHAAPALLVRASDHRLMTFYSHASSGGTYLRISTSSLDDDPLLADGFAAETTVHTPASGYDTYVQPIETGGAIRLLLRHTTTEPQFHWVEVTSADGGATWSAAATIVSDGTQRSYVRSTPGADGRIDYVASAHPFYTTDSSIFHFYRAADGTYHQSDGTAISLPLATSELTVVYDGTPARAWLWDIAPGPVTVYVVFEGTFPSDPWHYEYARWTGAAWDAHEVADAGTAIMAGEAYAGGIAIDRADTRTVYASVKVGSVWEMSRHITRDGGASWSSRVLTDSADKDVRPSAVKDASNALRAVWSSGSYAAWDDWSVGISGAGG